MRLASGALLVILPLAVGCGSRGQGNWGDGDEPDAGVGPDPDAGGSEVIVCDDPVPPATDGACDVTQGDGGAVLLRGTVLGLETVYENGAVLYEGTSILCTGCECGDNPA